MHSKPAPSATAAGSRQPQTIGQALERARAEGPLRQIHIPPCPQLLTQMQLAMAQPEPDLQTIARVASSDVAMSATLLRNANSAVHAAGQPVSSVGQALNRLGTEQSVSLMTDFLVRHAIPVNHPRLKGFWEQASERASTLNFVARQLPGLSPGLAQLYGLFSHVGMPVLLQSFRGYGATIAEGQARIDRSFVATENANHRTDHAVVGALVAHVWKLPSTLVAAIRLHHDLEVLSDASTEAEVRTLIAAGLVADRLLQERADAAPDRDWLTHQRAAMAWLGMDDGVRSEWLHQLQTEAEPV